MTISPPSSSEAALAFDRLAEPVRRWIWQQKWPKLRDVQEKAIPAVLAGGDVVISARTAAGKTEAAFLPLLTRILRDLTEKRSAGFDIVYVSPLKALINDQFRRLEPLLEACGLPIHRWHGDVPANLKQRARERPSGIVLITPESLEANLVLCGRDIERLFGSLQAVVIDELHAFIGSERGIQLQSILTRIEVAAGRDSVDRIGLSATLGDMRIAAEALRPGAGAKVTLIEGLDEGNGLKLQIRGYAEPRIEKTTVVALDESATEPNPPPRNEIVHPPVVDDQFRLLRGKRNLLFAGSRRNVEIYADALRTRCEEQRLPNEYFPHHGNLSKAEREDVEERLRTDPRPTTAVATTTLELGIDIGDVESVAQVGPGFSVASLRQRIGRSGRCAGRPAILRMFIVEPELEPGLHPVDRLRLDLIQAVAMVECLIENWCEPPAGQGLHLSTLIHQTLAAICQTGGLKPVTAWRLLCERGPFKTVGRDLYAELLRAMADPDRRLVEQSTDGTMMLGEIGERIAAGHDFYAVFATPEEYRVVHGERALGTLPLEATIAPGQTIIFSGRRWRVVEIDEDARVLVVAPTNAALPPTFGGDFGTIHDYVVAKMRDLFRSNDIPVYLDPGARVLLAEARDAYATLDLDAQSMVESGDGLVLFPWVGTRKLETLALTLRSKRIDAAANHHVIEIQRCRAAALSNVLRAVADEPAPDPYALARLVPKPCIAKFDRFLSPELRERVLAAERLVADTVPATAASLLR